MRCQQIPGKDGIMIHVDHRHMVVGIIGGVTVRYHIISAVGVDLLPDTFAVFGGFDVNFTLAHLCGGGLIFGAFFMTTDYVTSPITPKGQILFGILLGVLTGLFRLFGGSAEGVSYAIIISNLLVPLIEKVTLPVAFGKEAKK